MIGPTLDIIVRRRHWLRCAIRVAIVVLVIIPLTSMVSTFLLQIPYGWSNFLSRPIYTFRDELVYGGPYLMLALLLWLLESRFVRWIVPLPRMECPQCGYALRQLTTTRCPECGLTLGSTNPRSAG